MVNDAFQRAVREGDELCGYGRSDAIDDPSVGYSAAVLEADDSSSEQVPVDGSDVVGQQHVALVTQEDGTQQQVMEPPLLRSHDSASAVALSFPVTLNAPFLQVSISEADLQAMGGTITMVTQEGTTITIPAHELATQGAHSVTMVTADGTDEQVSRGTTGAASRTAAFRRLSCVTLSPSGGHHDSRHGLVPDSRRGGGVQPGRRSSCHAVRHLKRHSHRSPGGSTGTLTGPDAAAPMSWGPQPAALPQLS